MTSNNDRFYTLANKVRLRREHFGGLVFDEVQKAAIDVDRPCMRLLELARTGISPSRTTDILVQEKLVKNHQTQQQVGKLVSKLLLQGLLVEAAVYEHENSEKKETLESRDWPDGPNISAPEKIEWAITYKCGQDCPDCYAKHNYLQRRQDLQTEKALELIRKIAQWGVFQLDISGGEPLERSDLAELIRFACHCGLMVDVTTAADREIDSKLLDALSHERASLSVGIKPSDLSEEANVNRLKKLATLIDVCKQTGIPIKANLILTNQAVDYFEEALNENLDLSIELDCALTFVLRELPPEVAQKAGIKGCQAGRRIAALDPSGELFPCLQLTHRRYACGNLLNNTPDMIWQRAKRLKPFRSYLSRLEYRRSNCGVCKAKHFCNGCRLFYKDTYDGDDGCPGPELGPLHSLGKYGRAVDFKEHLSSHWQITVGEYMRRYRVSQQRAVKELKANPNLIKEDPNSKGIRKCDVYLRTYDDTIYDIQDSIGFTSGGAPHATYDEISEWIGSPSGGPDYPQWLDHKFYCNENDEADIWVPRRPKRKKSKKRTKKRKNRRK